MKKNIIIIITAILLAMILGTAIYFVKHSDLLVTSNEKDSFDVTLNNIIKDINEVNDVFNNMGEISYTTDANLNCHRYSEEKDIFINKLNDLYVKPFLTDGYFEILEKDKDGNIELEDNLYMCLPDNCKVKTININNVEIVLDEAERKIINIENNEFVLSKVNDEWKFNFPIVICE